MDAIIPKGYMTTRDLRAVLKVHGQLWLGSDAIGKLARGEYGTEQPDIQWLYDCAMERGNSEGAFDRDPLRLHFTNAGTCTLGEETIELKEGKTTPQGYRDWNALAAFVRKTARKVLAYAKEVDPEEED